MESDGDWTLARLPRRPLQTKLISGNFRNIAIPRRVATTAAPAAMLKNTALTAFGFIKTRRSPVKKRRRADDSTAFEVHDSQADSDDDPVPCQSCELVELSDAFEKLPSPSKRRKAAYGEPVSESTPSSDEAPSSPLAATRYQAFVTPRRTRVFDEVPSSLSYERYDYRPIDELDTPLRTRQPMRLPINTPISPPQSSKLSIHEHTKFRESSASKGRMLFQADTPAHVVKQLHTPPASRSTLQWSAANFAESSPIYVLADLGDDEIEIDNKENRRPPFEELPVTLIPTVRARETRFLESPVVRQTSSLASSAASLSNSVDLPIVWHDAVEYQSPTLDEAPNDVSIDALQDKLCKDGTLPRPEFVEDSQYEGLFDSLSPLNQHNNQGSSPAPPSWPQSYSWEPDSSLLETCLPPDFFPSQDATTTQGSNAPSHAHEATPEPQDPQRSSSKRTLSHPPEGSNEGKRQKNYDLPPDSASSDRYSFGLDESLMETISPPFFTL